MKYTAITAALVIGLFPSYSLAQTTCDILATGLRQDTLLQGSSLEQLADQQRAVCDQKNETFANASQRQVHDTLKVPGYVDAMMGSTSSDSNWGENFHKFCSSDASFFALNSHALNLAKTTSRYAYESIVECVNVLTQQQGTFALLTVNENRDSFAIKITHKSEGPNTWKLTGFTIVPPQTSGFGCKEDLHSVTRATPVEFAGSYTISCWKPASASVLLTVNTDRGSLPTFKLASIDDALAALKANVQLLEAQIAQTRADVLKARMQLDQVMARSDGFESKFVHADSKGIKLCSIVGPSWRDSIVVPQNFTREHCKEYKTKVGAVSAHLACIWTSTPGITISAFVEDKLPEENNSAVRNCGW